MKKSSVSQNKEKESQWRAGKNSQCFRDAEEGTQAKESGGTLETGKGEETNFP